MQIIVEKDVEVAMRDGVVLKTDVYRQAGRDSLPTLVQRLPYDKEFPALTNYVLDVMRAAKAGYAVVNQDTRGRWASGGEFHPFVDEPDDGVDTLAWVAGQPWSSGSIGMVGGSYFGATQWLAAAQRPEPLKAIAPHVTGDDYYEGWAYQGGAFQLGFNLCWCLISLGLGEVVRRLTAGAASPQEFGQFVAGVDANLDLYWSLPLTEQPAVREYAPYYFEWLAHPTYDAYWRAIAPKERYEQVAVPSLNIGGWYDLFLGGTLANYTGMRARGGSDAARRPRLIVGPWAHGNQSGTYAERLFGTMAADVAFDLTAAQLNFFDEHVRGGSANSDAPVRLFVMGANEWRDEEDWPLPDTRYERYYLHSGGHANTADGDGVLSTEPPQDEPEDVYLYDPRNPVPTTGGATFLPGLTIAANAGPRDQRAVEARSDVLVYTTAPLERPCTVIGPVELVLHASSSARDTDFTGKLVDVHPDGRADILTDGILRARYRESTSEPEPLEPGRVHEFKIDLRATANVFAVGHRIRLEVSSSNFPRFDRNTNTGGTIAEESVADIRQAVNRLHHDDGRPSHLVLPLIERD
jgi:putative CocE/NonD family hydrolase